MASILQALIYPSVKKRVSEVISSELTRCLPQLVEEIMREKFAGKSDRQLTAIGFRWALVLAFEAAWPDIDRKTAISCADDCMEIPYGTAGYDWSAPAAQELVHDYVSTFGESA